MLGKKESQSSDLLRKLHLGSIRGQSSRIRCLPVFGCYGVFHALQRWSGKGVAWDKRSWARCNARTPKSERIYINWTFATGCAGRGESFPWAPVGGLAAPCLGPWPQGPARQEAGKLRTCTDDGSAALLQGRPPEGTPVPPSRDRGVAQTASFADLSSNYKMEDN